MAILNALPNTFRSIRDHVNITPATLFLFIFQIGTIVVCSLIFPFLVRHFLTVPFVELNEPLEFTFQTCTDSLHGICSFPEAEIIFDEVIFKSNKITYSIIFRGRSSSKAVIDIDLDLN